MGKKKRQRRPAARTITAPRVSLVTRARRYIVSVLPTVAIILGARILIAEPYHIPSGSMEPTLMTGDWLYVNHMRFGAHVPFTNMTVPGYANPKRSEVVVFQSPPQVPAIRISPSDITPILVKRIVGLPGDTLVMRHGRLSVNGTAMPAPNTDTLADAVADTPEPLFQWQHAIEVKGSRFGAPVAAPSLHEWGPLVVPGGTYFMMGDNRDNSVDSRYYGPVPRGNFHGTPSFVYYSYDTDNGLPLFRALTEIRWRRIGSIIR